MLDAISWPHSVRDLLDALGMRAAPPETRSSVATLESIRQLMLDSADRVDAGKSLAQKTRLRFRIVTAPDAQALWYLRSDLMQVLSAVMCELEARRTLDGISALFDGLVPASLLASHSRQMRHKPGGFGYHVPAAKRTPQTTP